ncbi:DNA polymerase III, epsilon subunit [Geobacter metallireducens RCH3]|uniref:3'-to-5' exonuclease, putative n=1 Tax=Geobacter metallireducens (strain ATCC 53774 / DSM 7210 / GS-15) TaxID=269799 RepID=Q39R54_GEOMG|nr:3'-5' exonuclease [Geobacter metallireducens]ABB33270.1 3'-to-5' exonuclease, putative [Geobacter metallireducens GS-15]EHP85848.1 DNA polymerase III, epsilon subunit [Geobacter metallireducens RCH3]
MGKFTAVILDFETTGLSPGYGDRAIEIGAVLVRNNRIVDRFQSLMNPGKRVSGFIEEYTGITNEMLAKAPPAEQVMERFASFIAGHNLVAHNASFDRRFLDAELSRIGRRRTGDFACSMLAARRIYTNAPNHRLETLVSHLSLQTDGVFHRALADAEMTAQLWTAMIGELKETYRLRQVTFELMHSLGGVAKKAVPAYLERVAAGRTCACARGGRSLG